MESETKIAAARDEQESSRRTPSDMRRAKVEALSDDEEVITVRAPIAKLVGDA